ncbi:MAG: DUF3536 domain-containing protein [Anaerolineaceae bacterium]|nr:DUF3536 domain-containing protein [Anaerolineaceae bacterium]
MIEKSLCIHGHFYQPPREDPFSGVVPDEVGSAPYRNWNEKITAECYRPNAEKGNFGKISFNFGPTLFRWLEKNDPLTYGRIIEQERANYQINGVGNGMAQAYNHSILPLASYKDKLTQIRWGIADFEYRFKHKPEGMWLPETAVDLETLNILSDCGIQFTILAPWQVNAPELDTSSSYLIKLPGGRKPLKILLYNEGLSTAISFRPTSTIDGDAFLTSINQSKDSLVLLASDGELYGHHQPFRDIFLEYILNEGARRHNISLAYPSLILKETDTKNYVSLNEFTSWSCHHGVRRWSEECDCTPGAKWKSPMRVSMDTLGEELNYVYESYVAGLVKNPWQLRDNFIEVIQGKLTVDELLDINLLGIITKEEKMNIGSLLQAQYERQKIFTSCGWFFQEFHRIEPQNNISYVAKAIWLTKKATKIDLTEIALKLLSKVKSEKTGLRGDTVFSQTWIRLCDEDNLDNSITSNFQAEWQPGTLNSPQP